MSTDRHEATKAAMDGEGECELQVIPAGPKWHEDDPTEYRVCGTHAADWDPNETPPCYVHRQIDRAVRIGYEAGRRDALTEAADLVLAKSDETAAPVVSHRVECECRGCLESGALNDASDLVRSLLTTTKETDKP
jgi:hypothetical protein